MSLKIHDLKHLLSTKIHIDSYESKMGKDDDIITVSFKMKYRDPALDLMHFFEKGYDWVLDSDVSAGPMNDGQWLVFIEALRRPSFPSKLIDVLEDMEGITDLESTEYEFVYRDPFGKNYQPVRKDTLETVPLTPRDYRRRNRDQSLQNLLDSAGVPHRAARKYSRDVQEFANLARYR